MSDPDEGVCGEKIKLLNTSRLWLSVNDIRKELGVARSTVYAWSAEGILGVPLNLSGKKGGCLRFHRQYIERLLKDRLKKMSDETGIVGDSN